MRPIAPSRLERSASTPECAFQLLLILGLGRTSYRWIETRWRQSWYSESTEAPDRFRHHAGRLQP